MVRTPTSAPNCSYPFRSPTKASLNASRIWRWRKRAGSLDLLSASRGGGIGLLSTFRGGGVTGAAS